MVGTPIVLALLILPILAILAVNAAVTTQ
jgi:hypothetical protein